MVLRGTLKIFNDWFGEIIIVIEKKWSRVRFCEQVSNEDKLNLSLRHTYSLILAEKVFVLIFFV